MNMGEHLDAKGMARIPTSGTNVLADLCEFVITVISYARVQLPDGNWEVVPVRTVVKG